MYVNGRFVFIKTCAVEFRDKFVSDRLTSGDDNRRDWSTRLIPDAQERIGNKDSKFSLGSEVVEEIWRVKVVTGGGGGEGEQILLKVVEFVVRSRCFCVEAIVGRAKWGIDEETDEDEEEQVESVVFERDNTVESFISLLITADIVCIAESVSLR